MQHARFRETIVSPSCRGCCLGWKWELLPKQQREEHPRPPELRVLLQAVWPGVEWGWILALKCRQGDNGCTAHSQFSRGLSTWIAVVLFCSEQEKKPPYFTPPALSLAFRISVGILVFKIQMNVVSPHLTSLQSALPVRCPGAAYLEGVFSLFIPRVRQLLVSVQFDYCSPSSFSSSVTTAALVLS